MIGSGQTVDVIVLFLLVTVAIAIARTRGLLPAVMLTGIFSLLGAGWMLVLDAPDVAFTEAAVGAGISTILFLGTLAATTSEEKPSKPSLVGLVVVVVTGAVLVMTTFEMPREGDPNSPSNRSPITQAYLQSAVSPDEHAGDHAGETAAAHQKQGIDPEDFEVGIPNTVTTVLASFRGYDTMGETAVIFTAGYGVVMILLGARHRRYRHTEVDTAPHKDVEGE